jgi:hypothetical protein
VHNQIKSTNASAVSINTTGVEVQVEAESTNAAAVEVALT